MLPVDNAHRLHIGPLALMHGMAHRV
ncbi:protein of unknown function [Cupriavidus taiwanensis]|uniref:Uncharacterized protein n=1 Tax=Cupriavidus taiwanensis TaxID=164546 RepID=A0A375ICY5_9BURK|nr:protein of unknown function [Cupriavidus taiwanensis]